MKICGTLIGAIHKVRPRSRGDHIFGRPQRGGVVRDSTNMNKGREGVKNPENFADVLYGWPLRVAKPSNCIIDSVPDDTRP